MWVGLSKSAEGLNTAKIWERERIPSRWPLDFSCNIGSSWFFSRPPWTGTLALLGLQPALPPCQFWTCQPPWSCKPIPYKKISFSLCTILLVLFLWRVLTNTMDICQDYWHQILYLMQIMAVASHQTDDFLILHCHTLKIKIKCEFHLRMSFMKQKKVLILWNLDPRVPIFLRVCVTMGSLHKALLLHTMVVSRKALLLWSCKLSWLLFFFLMEHYLYLKNGQNQIYGYQRGKGEERDKLGVWD